MFTITKCITHPTGLKSTNGKLSYAPDKNWNKDTYIDFSSVFSKSISKESPVETQLERTSFHKKKHSYLKNERLLKVAGSLEDSCFEGKFAIVNRSSLSIKERTIAAWFLRKRLMTKFSGHIFEMINNWRHNRKEYDSAKKIQKWWRLLVMYEKTTPEVVLSSEILINYAISDNYNSKVMSIIRYFEPNISEKTILKVSWRQKRELEWEKEKPNIFKNKLYSKVKPKKNIVIEGSRYTVKGQIERAYKRRAIRNSLV